MAKRHEHTFQFTGRQISEAADDERAYHMMRVDYWRAEQDNAIEKARASGVDVREYDVTGGKQVNVVVDPEIVSRLSTCANKINTHGQAADRFQIEADAYATQPDRAYECHPDDVVYFRLCGGPRED